MYVLTGSQVCVLHVKTNLNHLGMNVEKGTSGQKIMSVFCVCVCVNLFQSLDFIFHFNLPGLDVVLRQPLALPGMLHLQLKHLQVVQLPAEIINELWGEIKIKFNSSTFSMQLFSYLEYPSPPAWPLFLSETHGGYATACPLSSCIDPSHHSASS